MVSKSPLIALGIVTNETVQVIVSQQKALDSLARIVLDNKIALDSILVEKGVICVVYNNSCYLYINTTTEVKTYLDKIRQLFTVSLSRSARSRLVFRLIFLNFSGKGIYFPRFLKVQVTKREKKFRLSLFLLLLIGYLSIKCAINYCTKMGRPRH